MIPINELKSSASICREGDFNVLFLPLSPGTARLGGLDGIYSPHMTAALAYCKCIAKENEMNLISNSGIDFFYFHLRFNRHLSACRLRRSE